MRICPSCQSVYHIDCWSNNRGCLHPDCRGPWWSLQDHGERWWTWFRSWYIRQFAAGPQTIPLHIWLMIGLVMVGMMAAIFLTPAIFHGEDLPHYTPR